MPLLSSLWAVGLSLLIPLVQAKLPLSSSGPRARLKEEEGVTFDPLGVAAVLHNPRVDTSAAMLYIQYDRGLFTWPHTTMIGGALPPMKMLLDHLTADVRSIHPAIKMCATHTTWLPVRSDVSGNVFHKLPLNVTTLWLRDVVAFRTSELPVNDFAVVYVDAIHEPLDVRRRRVKERMGAVRWRMAKWTLDLIGLLNGMLLLTGMVFGVLVADLWAFTLFFFYGCHWAASLLVSIRPVILIHKPPIKEDATVRYAVYEREEGGTVIFKGPQDKLEEWARCTWKYQSGFIPTCLHWSWMVTGTLAGIASVACMVNMRGYMQLAFLAVLIYSSVAEILAIRISRSLQTNAKGRIFHSTVLRNKQRTEAIIRATLQIEPKCRLQGLDWIKMRLLPPMDIFKNMQTLLAQINKMQDDEQDGTSQLDPDARNQLLESLFNEFVDGAGPLRSLAQRIVGEMKAALEDSWFADAGKDARAGAEKQVPVFHA
ncbi:hypothetical protein VTO42DRAFT_1494 [Malbranchea cinnamomea]